MEFTIDEMTRRLDAVRARMVTAGVDCLLVTGIENFSYFTGVPVSLYQQRRPWCAVIPVHGDPVALIMEGIDVTLERQGFIRNVQAYRLPVSKHLPPAVADLLAGCGARRVACELGLEQRLGMPLADFDAIRALLPSVEFVDGAAIIWSLRMFKSAEEIERMRRACEITGTTRQQLFKQVTSGMTEGDLADVWAGLMHDAGAAHPSFIYINTGAVPDFLPKSNRKLQPGDTLWVDGGVYVRGYTCDFSRVATLGPSSARQRRLHRDAVEVTGLLLEAIRPGVRTAELATICAREMHRRGYDGFSDPARVVAGHGMGMLINEPPLIAAWDETVLEEGFVAGIELGPVDPEGMFVWEEVVQVTHDGYDLLTAEASTLVEIPF